MITYLVESTATAELEAEQSYLRYGRVAPSLADRWHGTLLQAMTSLAFMPNRCPIAPETKFYPGTIVRHLIFGKHRLLYHVVEPEAEGEQGLVRILHILHGAQVLR